MGMCIRVYVRMSYIHVYVVRLWAYVCMSCVRAFVNDVCTCMSCVHTCKLFVYAYAHAYVRSCVCVCVRM